MKLLTNTPSCWNLVRWGNGIAFLFAVANWASVARAQGTITFDQASLGGRFQYSEQGMGFQVLSPVPPFFPPTDPMSVVGPGSPPDNGTRHMEFNRQYLTQSNYVAFALTNGSEFGLVSLDLASPSTTAQAVSMTFIGTKLDGSIVSTTTNTLGRSFYSFQFGPDFASGLASVALQAPIWAMDNLTFTIPEPSAAALALCSLLAFKLRKR